MTPLYKNIIICLIILLFDAIWIGFNIEMYREAVQWVQDSDMIVRPQYVILAYAMVLFATIYITIPFASHYIKDTDDNIDKLYKSFVYGGAVGFAIYGIYNLTSLSIYKNYYYLVAIKDTLWGTFLNTAIVFIYFML